VSTSTVRLTLPAKAEYLILVRLTLAGIAREIPMSESALADLKLAVTEVCANAVRHAYRDGTGVVRLLFTMRADAIEIVVEDDGPGFAPGELPEDPLAGEALLEDGMGLSISRAIVDELVVDGGSGGRGTIVRLTKTLSAA
jgi:serine/threonine-protein kinase RsbW